MRKNSPAPGPPPPSSGSKRPEKPSYHHGDLRRALIEATRRMIRDGGVEAVSLRKLAEQVGVSRTAAYHYFRDKNVLLCTLAEEGFERWQRQVARIAADDSRPPADRFRAYITWYMTSAADNPEYYDLMFGRAIWKRQSATDSLRTIAYAVFQKQVDMTREWQRQGVLPAEEDSLRLAQVTWGVLHGLARLLIDGVYTADSHMAEICACAARILMRRPPEMPPK